MPPTLGVSVVISVAIFPGKRGHLFNPIANRSTEMELEKPDWLQVPQCAGGEVSRARLAKDVKGKLQAGKGDHEIMGQPVLIIA
eukprot:6107883-Pyramimonas_sp.AAC.1